MPGSAPPPILPGLVPGIGTLAANVEAVGGADGAYARGPSICFVYQVRPSPVVLLLTVSVKAM